MTHTGEAGRLTLLISPRGVADQATARPYLGILPAMPSSVVLPRQVLPPQCLHPSCRKHSRAWESWAPAGVGVSKLQVQAISTFLINGHNTHCMVGSARFWRPSEKLTDRLVNYLLTEKREGKPWKYTSGELPWNNKSNQKLKPRNKHLKNQN